MQVVMGVCEELHVLDHGETICHGTPAEVRVHPKVLAAYLGEEATEVAASRATDLTADRVSLEPDRVVLVRGVRDVTGERLGAVVDLASRTTDTPMAHWLHTPEAPR